MKIVSWNVNSVKARYQHVADYLTNTNPDILLLQELKCETDAFPMELAEDHGYQAAIYGQKSYNGVAILSKYPLEDVQIGLPNFESDQQARYIEAVVSVKDSALRIASLYLPNGGELDSDKFEYKLEFFDKLREHAKTLLSYDEMLVIGGDYNVAAKPIDVYDPKRLFGTTCYHPKERDAFNLLCHEGLVDSYRMHHESETQYSWWDYRGGAWDKNHGMRIDYNLLSPQAADKCSAAGIDHQERGKERASDHAPAWVELSI